MNAVVGEIAASGFTEGVLETGDWCCSNIVDREKAVDKRIRSTGFDQREEHCLKKASLISNERQSRAVSSIYIVITCLGLRIRWVWQAGPAA
jgi:hypothetical protein